ncbi:MAG: hypothetical protein WA708_03395, partial [Acidobacteriaceae bacterium]
MRDSCALLVLFFCLIFSATLRGQVQPATPASTTPAPTAANPQTPAEFFARARELSDLEAAGIPFHLKATFVASGDAKFLGNGTYEEWWKDKNNWRKEAAFGDFRYVAFRTGDGDARIYTNSDDLPLPLQNLLDGFLVNIPADAGTLGKWKMRHKKIEKAKLISLEQDGPCVPDQKSAGEKCLQQGFFTPEGLIRIQVVNDVTTVYNDFRSFHGGMIPYTFLTGDGNRNHSLTISINQIEPLDGGVNLAEFPTGLHPFQEDAIKLYKP